MRVLAHRGNRLHAPENTRVALLSAYTAGADALELDVQLSRDGQLVVSHDPTLERLTGKPSTIAEMDVAELRKLDVSATFAPRGAAGYRYKQPGRKRVEVETLPALLDVLPRDVPKVIELKHDSAVDPARGEVMVRATLEAINARRLLPEVVLYSKDPETLRLVRRLAPTARICAFDWERTADEQLELMTELGADGVVIEIGLLLGDDGKLTDVARKLEKLHTRQGLAIGAMVYLYRDPAVFTREEHDALRAHPFVWSLATDSLLDVLDFARTPATYVEESFAGDSVDTDHFALGYAKANKYAHVFQDDGVHVEIAAYDGERQPTDDPVERRLRELEEKLWYAEKSWPFYSGGGVGFVPGIVGDFLAEVDYEVSRVGQASMLEMAVVNVDPSAHRPATNEDGTPFWPRSIRDKSSFFDPHGAPPFTGVEHDEDDGFRINHNLGSEYDNNQYGKPCGDGSALAGRLRLERRGAFFSAYYRNAAAPDWVCVGVTRNDSLNARVFLRCVGKRWRQELDDDPSHYHPIVPVHFVFRNLLIKRL